MRIGKKNPTKTKLLLKKRRVVGTIQEPAKKSDTKDLLQVQQKRGPAIKKKSASQKIGFSIWGGRSVK